MTKRLTLNTISAISDALNLALNEPGLLIRFFADEKTAAEWLDAKIASRA